MGLRSIHSKATPGHPRLVSVAVLGDQNSKRVSDAVVFKHQAFLPGLRLLENG